jgi:hypothetical protein
VKEEASREHRIFEVDRGDSIKFGESGGLVDWGGKLGLLW